MREPKKRKVVPCGPKSRHVEPTAEAHVTYLERKEKKDAQRLRWDTQIATERAQAQVGV